MSSPSFSQISLSSKTKSLSLFEFWPASIFYTPIILYWVIMGLKYRDFSTPTAANPRIETGGLCGESKSSILDMAGNEAKKFIAPYCVFQNQKNAFALAINQIHHHALSFPLVLKPDIGCQGSGVKLIANEQELKNALALFPRNINLMAQQLIIHPIEVGIFYIRHPHHPKGKITSLTYKEEPVLIGNGKNTLKELLLQDQRMAQLPQLYLPRLKGREDFILPKGERLPLVFAGNHCKGSIFRDGCNDITPKLADAIDRIMQDIPDFHFGRLDIKIASQDDLKNGKNFQIIEINGVGSEAIHIWDKRTTLKEAYRAQFYHYRQSFLIGAAKKKMGWKSSGALTMLRAWLKHRRLMALYPTND